MCPTLDLSDQKTLSHFISLAFIRHHLKYCHIEDYKYFEAEYEKAKTKIVKIFWRQFRRNSGHKISEVLHQTHNKVWSSPNDFISSYNMWTFKIHSINNILGEETTQKSI